MPTTLSADFSVSSGDPMGRVLLWGEGVGSEGERRGRRGGEGWALLISRLDDRVTLGKRVGTERGVLAEVGLLRALPLLLELFRDDGAVASIMLHMY